MSEYFDPSDKKNKVILDYFESKTWLIVDPSTSTRTSIKKSVIQLGSKMSNMIDCDNFTDALKIIETKKPHYVIGNNTINGGSTTQLFDHHLKNVPNRLGAGFFIIADSSAIEEIALELEYDMDGIIIQPFTGSSVIDSVLQSAKTKIAPSTYINKIEEGRASLLKGNLERAMESFQTAVKLNARPYEGFYYLGQIYTEYELQEKAISSYEESVQHNPEYFKSLNKLRTIYYQKSDFKKAYDINLSMAKKYPTPSSKIPELIRLSIINKKYEDINNYLKIYHTIRTPEVRTQTYLSAGLAILGKYFINQNETDKGIDALKGSFKFSNGKYEILKNLSQSFEECEQLDILLNMFEETDLDQWPEDVQGVYFHVINLTSKDDQMVIMAGERLLSKKIKDILIYKGLIQRSIKMKRKMGSLEGLVLEAIRDFPDHKSEFEELLNNAQLIGQ
jgi:tetratricopeptide (TPR) repeat protein